MPFDASVLLHDLPLSDCDEVVIHVCECIAPFNHVLFEDVG